jgi:hypothetical protein
MFIDTATANSRSLRPQIMVSSHPESHNDTETPLLETFVGQDAPPPTYLEATTPGLYSSRLSEDQGARLLVSGDREERDAAVKEDQYRRKILRAQCTKTIVLKWAAAAMTIFLLAAVLAVMAAAVSVRGDKQVCFETGITARHRRSYIAGRSSKPSSRRPTSVWCPAQPTDICATVEGGRRRTSTWLHR